MAKKRVKMADGGMLTSQVMPYSGTTTRMESGTSLGGTGGVTSTRSGSPTTSTIGSTSLDGTGGTTSLRNAPMGSTGGTTTSAQPLGSRDQGGMGPNAPAGRGYNREGFRGRGPVGSRMGQGDMGGMGSSIGYGPTPSVTGGPAPMTGGPLPTTTSMQPLGTPRIGFKKGGMVSKSGVSKGKHSSVTPSGGRAGGKSKACKIY